MKTKIKEKNKSISSNIQAYRVEQGVTLQQLSDCLGVTPQQAQKYCSGMNSVAVGALPILAKLFNKKISDFFNDNGNKLK